MNLSDIYLQRFDPPKFHAKHSCTEKYVVLIVVKRFISSSLSTVLEMNFFSNCCFVKIMKRNSRYKIYNFHIANSAICILEVGDVRSGDVLVTVSTKCFSKKSKDKKFDILHYRNCLFLVCTRNDNISRGCNKNGISRGEGGPFCKPILENPDGRVA